jgi:hypothetical protein
MSCVAAGGRSLVSPRWRYAAFVACPPLSGRYLSFAVRISRSTTTCRTGSPARSPTAKADPGPERPLERAQARAPRGPATGHGMEPGADQQTATEGLPRMMS